MSNTINVKVLLFASIREKIGNSSITITLHNRPVVKDAISALSSITEGKFRVSEQFMVALNGEYTTYSTPLQHGDELAIIPPVSGGAEEDTIVKITHQPLNQDVFVKSVMSKKYGAVVTFIGVTRDQNLNRSVQFLEYEAYNSMAYNKIHDIIADIRSKWQIGKIAVAHRTGKVELGEISMVVAVSAKHRKEALESVAYFVDTLKQVVPIWKKEHFENGSTWITTTPGNEVNK